MLDSNAVFLNLTTRCNLKCAKCWRSQVWGKGQDIERDVLDKFMDSFSNYKGRIIVGSGENLICQHLEDFIDWVNENEIDATILTTALKFDKFLDKEKFFTKNIQWGVTMDGYLQHQVIPIQKGMNIERVKKNLEIIKGKYKNANFYINYTHTKLNLEDTIHLIDFASSLNINKFYITQLKLFEGLDDSITKEIKNNFDCDEFKKVMSNAEDVAKKKGIYLYAPLTQRERKCFDCKDKKFSQIIDVNGDISFCYGRDDEIIGNILDDNGERIWDVHLNKLLSNPEKQKKWCSLCHATKTNENGYFYIPKSKN
ncbi:TPA: radical SAM protein [Aeromonas veronii]|uniref:radical SAM protein n=1 Tax=Aeromonas veronii TaxID=654 RepID=UPI003A323367